MAVSSAEMIRTFIQLSEERRARPGGAVARHDEGVASSAEIFGEGFDLVLDP
jgi:hypothetical protein